MQHYTRSGSTPFRDLRMALDIQSEYPVVFFLLKRVLPNAINGEVVRTYFLPAELEGKPTAWVFEDVSDHYVARTNMSEWISSPIFYGWDDLGDQVVHDQKVSQAIDIASGSREACLAAIRLYNM